MALIAQDFQMAKALPHLSPSLDDEGGAVELMHKEGQDRVRPRERG